MTRVRKDLDLPLEISAEEEAFFKQRTRIEDTEQLYAHIKKVQADGYEAWPYHCIRAFNFLRFKVAGHPIYPQVLKKKDEPEAYFLDMGCCFGTDLRKLAIDGYPSNLLLGGELMAEFVDLGYTLFIDDPTDPKLPTFFIGDIFSPEYYETSTTLLATLVIDPSSLSRTSITPFRQRIRVLHASSFFHLFDEEQQDKLARILATMIVPKAGTILFGSHVGNSEMGTITSRGSGRSMFCHSPESFTKLWEDVLGEDKVRVDVRLVDSHDARQVTQASLNQSLFLYWSVTLL